ncbi:MAG: hypothetical protein IT318_09205 [Anaerolineales bacterium]|nr:hypothetical protein [Anaerolineales bacterium]
MQSKIGNRPLAPLLRALLWLTVPILLGAGGALFFFPDWARPRWPWELAPFNAAFLGAFYLSAGAGVAVLAFAGAWWPARVILPMIFVFTATLLLFSLLEARRFIFTRWATYGWFLIYLGLPIITGLALWRCRDWPAPQAYPTPPGWRNWLLGVMAVMGLYGFVLFLFPTVIGAYWPWPLDEFHGRAYSVIFTVGAIGLLGLAQFSAPGERMALGLATSLMGLFAIFGVVIVDASRHVVAWGNAGVWLWLALFAIQFVTGLGLIWWSSAGRAGSEG